MKNRDGRPRRRRVTGGLAALGALFLLMVVVEVGGQALFRLKEGRWLFQGRPAPLKSFVFRHHPYLVGMPAADIRAPLWGKKLTVTGERSRWTGAPPATEGRIRVAVLGGATTFGAYLSDEETWPAQLQSLLGDGYVVYNFGVPGYSTAEHVIQTALILPEIEPDVVVYYTGWDDIRNYHRFDPTPEYREHGIEQYDNLEISVVQRLSFGEELKVRSGAVRMFQFVGNKLGMGGSEAEDAAPVPEGAYEGPDAFVDRIYRRNLTTLRELVRMQGGYALFVPQVLNKAAFAGSRRTRPWTPRIIDEALPGLMRRFNGLMTGLCEDAPCAVVEEVTRLPWTPEHFLDEGHFNAEGGRLMAETLAARIRSLAASTID
ncbi:SGNH/GDSL hydrolase family protein [Rhodocaloribacter sp.]